MTQDEMVHHFTNNAVPHRFTVVGEGDSQKQILMCLDLSQIPGVYRDHFDEQGVWKELVTSGNQGVITGDSAVNEDQLPDDFPGHAALAAAGISTYSELIKAGDVTQVNGIGPATQTKIAEALASRVPVPEETK